MKAPDSIMGRTAACVKCGAAMRITAEIATPVYSEASTVVQSESESSPARPKQGVRSAVTELMLSSGLISEDQAAQAEAQQMKRGGRVYAILIEQGMLDNAAFGKLMSSNAGVASVGLEHYAIDSGAVSLLPPDFLRERLALPIDKLGRLLTLAMVCPLDEETIQEVRDKTGLRVNPMLCSLVDLRAAFKKHLHIEDSQHEEEADFSWMGGSPAKPASSKAAPASAQSERAEATGSGTAIEARIDTLDALPVAPETVERASLAAQDSQYPVRDLSMICCADPVIVARLLSLTNSAAYGMPGRVDNANLAATLLGASGILKVIGTATAVPALDAGAQFDYEGFLSRSRFCAAAAQALAKASKGPSAATAFTAGLIYDIGLITLARLEPGTFSSLEPADWGPVRAGLESKALGVGHPEAGYLLAKAWRLPISIAEAIRFHHELDRARMAGPLAAIVAAAARMAGGFRLDNPEEPETVIRELSSVLESVRLTATAAQSIYENTLTMFRL